MQAVKEQIEKLFQQFSKEPITAVDKLPCLPAASGITFVFILQTKTFIATYGANLKENESFIYFSKHFRKKQLATPEIFCINTEKNIYLQEDFGDTSLLNNLRKRASLLKCTIFIKKVCSVRYYCR